MSSDEVLKTVHDISSIETDYRPKHTLNLSIGMTAAAVVCLLLYTFNPYALPGVLLGDWCLFALVFCVGMYLLEHRVAYECYFNDVLGNLNVETLIELFNSSELDRRQKKLLVNYLDTKHEQWRLIYSKHNVVNL